MGGRHSCQQIEGCSQGGNSRFYAKLLLFLCLLFCLASAKSQAKDEPDAQQLASVKTVPWHVIQPWFFNAILPYHFQDTSFLALSLSPDGVHSKPRIKPIQDLLAPMWLDFWRGGTSNVAQLRLGNYDLARNVPFTVATSEDLYLFFLSHGAEILPQAPVLRHSPGGWAWQSLDTVEQTVRQAVRIADFTQGKVFDATGTVLTNIEAVTKTFADPTKVVNLGCQLQQNEVVGVAGVPAVTEDEWETQTPLPGVSRPPLPYSTLYFYQQAPHSRATVHQLMPIMPITAPPKVLTTATSLNDVATSITAQDQVFLGKPVWDGKRVFYWYCIQATQNRAHQVFILACFDGNQTYPVDGYIADMPDGLLYWQDNKWIERHESLSWLYQDALKLAVQPLVGLDADKAVVIYRPPDLMRLVGEPVTKTSK